MKNCIARLFLVLCPAWLCFAAPSALAQANAAAEDPKLAADEKEACIHNLNIIFRAIQAYRADHKDIPNWLSDLVPQYLDAGVLICPTCKRTGQIESSALADPVVPSSYLYQFCPVPLGKEVAPADPTKTYRDWKRHQMGLAGSIVPIVICQHHGVVLNLAFDGRIYESPGAWEDLLTNQMNVTELEAGQIFATASNPGTTPTAAAAKTYSPYPPRDPQAKPSLIDLSEYYNASLTKPWHGTPKDDLASLPDGLQTLAGVEYDVRGIIQLASQVHSTQRFPARIDGIIIRQKCERLHFLHAALFGSITNDGNQVGSYIVHFATNHMQFEIPIIYGHDLRDWHKGRNEKPAEGLTVAWTGTNEAYARATAIRLYTTTWANISPDMEIESIDFVSAMGRTAPFLIAITAE
jgi:hypothetical protein